MNVETVTFAVNVKTDAIDNGGETIAIEENIGHFTARETAEEFILKECVPRGIECEIVTNLHEPFPPKKIK